MADTPSKLLSGDIYYNGRYIPIEAYRDIIFSRSLYSLDNQYENTNKFSLNNKSNVASSISTVLNVIPQYNRMQVNSNLIGNTYDAFRDDGSALAKIGIIMLGKQMAYNSAMNLSLKYIPSINLTQALKGNPDKIFNFNKNNTITVQDTDSDEYTFGDRISKTASNLLGIDTYDIFGNANPFTKNPTNLDYIKNTGAAQLTHFYNAINLNIYKPINSSNTEIIEYSKKAGVDIDFSRKSILGQQPTFTFGIAKFHPYINVSFNRTAVDNANIAMDISISGNSGTVQEYAPNKDSIVSFGKTSLHDKTIYLNDFVKTKSNITTDDKTQHLVWGRDDVGANAEAEIGKYRGDEDIPFNNPEVTGFGIKKGLLEYTKNLLNASSGQFVDITRKAFKDGNGNLGFQGSGLWQGNFSDYSVASGNALKTGVRQHTVLDPYGSDTTEQNDIPQGFAKSIRFKGNIVYNAENKGNQNSVIYKTVLPRIHPTRDDNGKINQRNLMFSLENLAIGTIAKDTFGVIDDEFGTPIPLSEVGPFAGRQMWFPPYNISINEVAAAKYESTVMVGRNEPMYNYMNSERSAVLSFSLLVDYPEQLRSAKYTDSDDKNKIIADFFAFGGDSVPRESKIERIQERIDILRNEYDNFGGPSDQSEPPDPSVPEVVIYFQNDKPIETEIESIINIMYNNPNHYEIIEDIKSAQDKNGFGLNKEIYFIENITGSSLNNTLGVSGTSDQYTTTRIYSPDNNQECKLNANLWKVFSNPNFRKYYQINIVGRASLLYLNDNEKEYNQALGLRRANAAKHLITSRLAEMFNKTVSDEIALNIVVSTIGSTNGDILGEESKYMHERVVKENRAAFINIVRKTIDVDKKEYKLNPTDEERKLKIRDEIQVLEFQLSVEKNNNDEHIFNERNKAILNGFESISGNQFLPAFHSQTPEDFHRRLTFLQQCTRQGAAKRYDIIDKDTGDLRAKNSVFGRQPICILRIGDFLYTKVIIESVTIDYADTTWDMNPEGFGMQPMMANVTLQMKVIGGQSLSGPIDALQNAVTFNYYANSTFTDRGMYNRPSQVATLQNQYQFGVDGKGGTVGEKQKLLNDKYTELTNKVSEGDK